MPRRCRCLRRTCIASRTTRRRGGSTRACCRGATTARARRGPTPAPRRWRRHPAWPPRHGRGWPSCSGPGPRPRAAATAWRRVEPTTLDALVDLALALEQAGDVAGAAGAYEDLARWPALPDTVRQTLAAYEWRRAPRGAGQVEVDHAEGSSDQRLVERRETALLRRRRTDPPGRCARVRAPGTGPAGHRRRRPRVHAGAGRAAGLVRPRHHGGGSPRRHHACQRRTPGLAAPGSPCRLSSPSRHRGSAPPERRSGRTTRRSPPACRPGRPAAASGLLGTWRARRQRRRRRTACCPTVNRRQQVDVVDRAGRPARGRSCSRSAPPAFLFGFSERTSACTSRRPPSVALDVEVGRRSSGSGRAQRSATAASRCVAAPARASTPTACPTGSAAAAIVVPLTGPLALAGDGRWTIGARLPGLVRPPSACASGPAAGRSGCESDPLTRGGVIGVAAESRRKPAEFEPISCGALGQLA